MICFIIERINMRIIEESMVHFLDRVSVKEELIDKIAETLLQNNRICDKIQYIHDVFERESIVSTAIGDEIAIPHALSESVMESSLVFIRLKKPVYWNQDDEVRMIFGIAVPKHSKQDEHLKILANVARKMMNPDFKRTLLHSSSKKDIVDLLNALD
jgi:fructose PTS system EIIA component